MAVNILCGRSVEALIVIFGMALNVLRSHFTIFNILGKIFV